MRTIVLVAIALAGMSCAHKSMNVGSLRKSRSRQKRGETKIALNFIANRAALVEDFCRR
jgi:hypothetical protein